MTSKIPSMSVLQLPPSFHLAVRVNLKDMPAIAMNAIAGTGLLLAYL
jgi:hypothetical protein